MGTFRTRVARLLVAAAALPLVLLIPSTGQALPAGARLAFDPGQGMGPAAPPLAKSDNVEVLGNLAIGTSAGMTFKDHYAFVTGWAGVSVLDIAEPADPVRIAFLALPHFENEDVDLCGDVLLVSNDRESRDLGSVLYVIDISNPAAPSIQAVLPLGLTGQGRGSGHIANFVKADCSMAWIDGGDHVEVVDLSDPSAPRSLGKFESVASLSDAFKVTHDTELDSRGIAWSVGGGGAAGYKITRDPLKPRLLASTGPEGTNPSKYNDFILHNSQRRGNVLLVTEEDYIDTSETPPGGCRGQGQFETWSLANFTPEGLKPLDTWTTELNGLLTGGSEDSKAPVTVNCSSHWFDTQRNLAAVGWYEQGTRILAVDDPTNVRQVGYYIPANGSTWAAYWSPTDPTRKIVYTADVYLGIDVLRVNKPTRNADMPTLTAPIPDQWFGTTALPYRESPTFKYFCPIAAPAA
jgi:LVIVD repeat-containing protein